MSPENTHKLMGFYMEVIILGVNTMYNMFFCFFKLFLVGCIGLSIGVDNISVVLVNHNYYQTSYSEPLKDLVNCTVAEIMEPCAQCH